MTDDHLTQTTARQESPGYVAACETVEEIGDGIEHLTMHWGDCESDGDDWWMDWRVYVRARVRDGRAGIADALRELANEIEKEE